MREVDHRAKNALAVVQSVVRLSRSEDAAGFAEAVEGRVDARVACTRFWQRPGGRAPTWNGSSARNWLLMAAQDGS